MRERNDAGTGTVRHGDGHGKGACGGSVGIRFVSWRKRILVVGVMLIAVGLACSLELQVEPVGSTPEPTWTPAGRPTATLDPAGTAEPDLWARLQRLEAKVALLEMYLDQTLSILGEFGTMGGLIP